MESNAAPASETSNDNSIMDTEDNVVSFDTFSNTSDQTTIDNSDMHIDSVVDTSADITAVAVSATHLFAVPSTSSFEFKRPMLSTSKTGEPHSINANRNTSDQTIFSSRKCPITDDPKAFTSKYFTPEETNEGGEMEQMMIVESTTNLIQEPINKTTNLPNICLGNWRCSDNRIPYEGDADESESDSNDDNINNVSSDELDEMLEAGLPDEFKRRKLRKGCNSDDVGTAIDESNKEAYEEKEKIVMIEKGHNHFDVLPEGWIQVTHNSGMPMYLNKSTRVCTFSKPYFLGGGSARKHKIPLSAIPCLNYKRALEKEEEEQKLEKEKESADNNDNQKANDLWLPNARIETVQENLEVQSLDAEELRNYCQRRFKFTTIKVMRFKSWPERRKYTKKNRHAKQLNRPTLPEGTKLITFPIQTSNSDHPTKSKKEWIMNPNGKSFVCILHEYVQHALKKQPSYEFRELENAAMPYSATVSINDMKYGIGYGTSKKQAKSDAARATLEILIPQMRDKITAESEEGASIAGRVADHDLSFFDDIKIEDPRVADFCAKTTEPSPHSILLTCLQRNFGLTDSNIDYHGTNAVKHQKNEFTMTVGKHTATVVCKNKRDGKQRASQAILQALHPHITSWGSLLRLYGNRSVKSFREKKQEEQEITQLQSKAAVNSPNYAILDKLRMEMRKLKVRRMATSGDEDRDSGESSMSSERGRSTTNERDLSLQRKRFQMLLSSESNYLNNNEKDVVKDIDSRDSNNIDEVSARCEYARYFLPTKDFEIIPHKTDSLPRMNSQKKSPSSTSSECNVLLKKKVRFQEDMISEKKSHTVTSSEYEAFLKKENRSQENMKKSHTVTSSEYEVLLKKISHTQENSEVSKDKSRTTSRFDCETSNNDQDLGYESLTIEKKRHESLFENTNQALTQVEYQSMVDKSKNNDTDVSSPENKNVILIDLDDSSSDDDELSRPNDGGHYSKNSMRKRQFSDIDDRSYPSLFTQNKKPVSNYVSDIQRKPSTSQTSTVPTKSFMNNIDL